MKGTEPYRHVGDPRWLEQQGLFVAEGRFVVERLIATRRFPIESILVSEAAAAAMPDVLSSAGCEVHVRSVDELRALTGFDFHRGCLALARRPVSESTIESLASSSRVLALEGIGNPDNVGGLFRVAAAFGAAVVLDPTSGDPFYRKAIRTSMGAVLTTPFARCASWPDDLREFTRAGFSLVALTPSPDDARPLAHFAQGLAFDARIVWLLGAEGRGLSAEAFAVAHERLWIPIDPAVDSLNVVVAAGIALASQRGERDRRG